MPPNTSYPSPNATQMGEGLHPFYHPTPHHMASSAEHHMPSAEEQLQMSAHLSREVPPNMTGNIVDGQAIAQRNHNIHAQNMRQGPMGSPQQIAQSGLNSNHDPNLTESPKKRSKVSRACDECRRKKIRCDAASENADEQCSSCKRVGSTCKFSRVPLKRGPSKGYIKELAERVGKLEYYMPSGQSPEGQHPTMQDNTLSPQGRDQSTPPATTEFGTRKRSYSMSEGLHNSGYIQASGHHPNESFPTTSTAPWAGHDASRHLSQQSPAYQHQPLPQASYDMSHNNNQSQMSPSGVPSATWAGEHGGHTDTSPVAEPTLSSLHSMVLSLTATMAAYRSDTSRHIAALEAQVLALSTANNVTNAGQDSATSSGHAVDGGLHLQHLADLAVEKSKTAGGEATQDK